MGIIMKNPVVFIVDDDESVRKALKRLLKSAGINARALSSAEEFLNQGCHNVSGCLVLDVRMPGMNGLELQEELVKSGSTMPIIFISAHEDASERDQAMKAGAITFIQKPLEDQIFIEAVNSALSRIKNGTEPQRE